MANEVRSEQFTLNNTTAPKLTSWTNEPTVQLLKMDLEASKPAHDTRVANITRWTELLKVEGTQKPKKHAGRSSVQPKVVRRQAEWRYSALTEPFLSSPKLFQISPRTWEDTKAASQNELVLNYQFDTKFNRVQFIDHLVRATVDEGTSIVRLGWTRVTEDVEQDSPVYDHYQITDPNALQILNQAIQLSQTDPNTYNTSVDPAVKASVDYYNQTGIPTTCVQNGTTKVKVTKIIENRPTAELLNPTNFYLDPSCNGDMSKALFAIVTFETNQAELKREPDKYKNLDRVNWAANTPITNPEHGTNTPDSFQQQDDLRRRVVAYEYWGWYDIKKDGKLVPIVATWIGDCMIRMEENPFPDGKLPFVIIPYMPIKRDIWGEPDAELLEDNQKIIGAVTRGMIDLLGRSANAQQGMAKGMLDPLNRRKFENGQDYEYNPQANPANSLIQHKYPEFPQSAFQMLTMQNGDAEALTGVKSFSGGISGAAYGDVAAGIRGALDAASKREMAILRRIAKGVGEIGDKITSMNAVFLSKTEVVRITNDQFVTVNRDDLAGDFDLKVDIETAEIDDQKAKDLGFMLQTMGPNMPFSFTGIILAQIADLKRMPELAHSIRNYQPQPDPFTQQKQQLELQKMQAEIDTERAQAQVYLAQAKAYGSKGDLNNLDFVEQETGTKHARDMALMRAQSEGNQNLEVTKALTKPTKEGESKPNIPAAIGWNTLSQNKDDNSVDVPTTNSGLPAPAVATTVPQQPQNPGFSV